VRIDEQLRLKQLHLNEFNKHIEGFSESAELENVSHKRLVYQMRCYLYVECRKKFGFPNMSYQDFLVLKSNFMAPSSTMQSNVYDIFSLEPVQLQLLISERADTLNSVAFYKKLISEILGSDIPYSEKKHVTDAIVERFLLQIQ